MPALFLGCIEAGDSEVRSADRYIVGSVFGISWNQFAVLEEKRNQQHTRCGGRLSRSMKIRSQFASLSAKTMGICLPEVPNLRGPLGQFGFRLKRMQSLRND